MSHNIEVKARVRDLAILSRLAGESADTGPEILAQRDVFFHVPKGRLKLRYLAPDHGQLITYERADCEGPKSSRYEIFETREPALLERVLAANLAVRGFVVKQRAVYLAGQTRIHLDVVEGLGDFLELEVVLYPGQTAEEGQTVAKDLMNRLGIRSEDLVEGAYIDLLEEN